MDAQRRILEDAAIAVKGDAILALGPRAEIERKYAAPQTISAKGKLVLPGFINGHTHVPMTLFRGLHDDVTLDQWLRKYIFPAEAKNVNEEFVRWGTRLGCLEMIRGGTTTYVDMYYFEDAIALMQTGRYRNVPLLDEEDHLIGVVRPQDILKFLAEAFPEELLNLPPRPHQRMRKAEGG